MQELMPISTAFSLTSVVDSHGWVQLAPFERGPHGQTLTYVGQLSSGRVTSWSISTPLSANKQSGQAAAKQAAAAHDQEILLQLDDALTPADVADIRHRVRWMLALDQDLSDFYAVACHEPKLAHVEPGAHGRLLRSATLFEDVVKTILTTNTTWSGTRRMVAALVTHFGAPLEPNHNGTVRRAFPTPEALAAADLDLVRNHVKLGYRAPYVIELARRVASGELDLESLKESDLPTPELRKQLLAIKGVGAYAAANLLLLLGRHEYVPIDSWAIKLVGHEWHNGAAVTPAQVEDAFAAWGPWKGLAYWFWQWKYHEDE